jgi:hypothetical protein
VLGLFVALLTIATRPVTAPTAVGLNVTLIAHVLPGATAAVQVPRVAVNAADPVTVTAVTVNGFGPVLDTVTVRVWVAPILVVGKA